MFDDNIIAFNPGWDDNAQDINPFTDIRELQKQFIKKGIKFDQKIDQSTKRPASFVITDPDGNKILVDQHR